MLVFHNLIEQISSNVVKGGNLVHVYKKAPGFLSKVFKAPPEKLA